MKRVLQFISFVLIALFSLPFALLPFFLSLKIGESMGALLFHLWKNRRTIAVENLRGAVLRGAVIIDSTPETVIKQNFKNMGKSFVEIVKIYFGLGKKIFDRVEVQGADNFRTASAKKAGVIFITGHCGNWELNPAVLAMKVTKVNAVARVQNNPFLNSIIERTRGRYGNKTIYKQGALKKILLALKRNETVGILMDQSVVRSEGVTAEFLGKKDHIMKTPAIIARKTGSPVLPVFIRRRNGGHVLEIGKEIELDASADYEQAVHNDTVRFSGCIENYIKKNPAEWLWMHRRWKRIKE
jgi:Kdo2-lipid IVA lauroyltransferase/acyltransferase